MTGSNKVVRLSKAAREFNISIDSVVIFLKDRGYDIERNPNTKLEPEMYNQLTEEFRVEKEVKEISRKKGLEFVGKDPTSNENTVAKRAEEYDRAPVDKELMIKNVGVAFKSNEKIEKVETPKAEIVEETIEQTEPPSEKEPELDSDPVASNEVAQNITEEPKDEIKEEVIDTTNIEEAEPIAPVIVSEEEETPDAPEGKVQKDENSDLKVLGKIDLENLNQKTRPKKKSKEDKRKEQEEKKGIKAKVKKEATVSAKEVTDSHKETKDLTKEVLEEKAEDVSSKKETTQEVETEDRFIKTKFEKLSGPKIVDKIELPVENKKPKKKKPVASSDDNKVGQNKKKRRRIKSKATPSNQSSSNQGQDKGNNKKRPAPKKRVVKEEPSEEEIQKKIKDTLARLAPSGKSKAAKHRRKKRETVSQNIQEELLKQEEDKKTLKVTEFVTANELANMMDVSVTDIITSCMQLGLFVSINQRLDAETIVLVAEEFGYKTSFVSVEEDENLEVFEEEDDIDSLVPRAPIVTVMGHVDHGKTKLLDYIRNANVVSGEAGGITQHIGAYEVKTETGKRVTFLDTPGHEAFTAMRARGAKVTDVAIIVIAADDSVMPQTKEAINHAQAAGVPIVFAINKMDKPDANSEKVKEQLANMNILVEDWGGKFQSQEISAITGMGINELLEKVLLESELLELKANPDKGAKGTVIEASLDKGRGYVTTILVQDGTLKKGDIILAGPVSGKVKAMFNERNENIESVGPSQPVLILGLISAPQAGDVFNVMKEEKEAKSLASKRQQLIREQGLRTQKHVTLDEIGRRIAIGDFKEINIIVKGDVDGSIEALTDSLIKLSTDEVQVNVIHKAVGAISESDVMLASASDAIIIGFQVRPTVQARKRAENEQIDIRLYSIIYQATEELEKAIKGMLAPKTKEEVVCNIEVRETFKITKVGTIAGCYVLHGKVHRNTKVRVIRDGIVVYTGLLGSLKRFKDDVKEVASGFECGLNIENFNDIKVGDIVEGYEMVEIAR
ncbi:MAG: translation initiation factor IF-2 [Lentimicrobiaceae bacterium]|nr:translation initiation factor IF-2 [Lentimicrobiaceae bacterium]